MEVPFNISEALECVAEDQSQKWATRRVVTDIVSEMQQLEYFMLMFWDEGLEVFRRGIKVLQNVQICTAHSNRWLWKIGSNCNGYATRHWLQQSSNSQTYQKEFTQWQRYTRGRSECQRKFSYEEVYKEIAKNVTSPSTEFEMDFYCCQKLIDAYQRTWSLISQLIFSSFTNTYDTSSVQ